MARFAAIGAILAPLGCDASNLDVLDPARPPVDASAADVAEGAPSSGCLSVGGACSFAGQCCALACVTQQDGGAARCAQGPACAVAGAPCNQSTDCCSDDCTEGVCALPAAPPPSQGPPPPPPGSMCKPAGEACMHDPDCCGARCTSMRCELLAGCRVEGEICGLDSDCCSELCIPDADGVGRCRPSGSCGAAGEICGTNADCCAGTSCAPDPSGARRCQGG